MRETIEKNINQAAKEKNIHQNRSNNPFDYVPGPDERKLYTSKVSETSSPRSSVKSQRHRPRVGSLDSFGIIDNNGCLLENTGLRNSDNYRLANEYLDN